jgi:nickel/cobalt exporter
VPQKIEAWLALLTGALVVLIGLWSLWQQRSLIIQLNMPQHLAHTHDHSQSHAHAHGETDAHHHPHDPATGFHSHGLGIQHSHDLSVITGNRPSLLVLMGLGIAGGLVPDPAALALLLTQLAQGKVMFGLIGVLVFSLGFAATLVLVGIVAAKVGERILDWLAGTWAMRMQIGTSLLIIIVGVVLTFNAALTLATLK